MAAGLPPSPPLDETIARGQAGLREDAEVVHGTLALLREAAGKTVAELAADDAFIGAFAPLLTAPSTYTWNADGTPATMTVADVTTTYAWNANGTLNTETRNGTTRTYTWNVDGTLASVA